MTVSLPRLGGSAKAFSPPRLAITLYRLGAILLAFYLIKATRADNRVDTGLLISLAVFIGLYLVFGRKGELRPVILYLILTGFSAQVRLFGDQTGIPVHFDYVVWIERTVFGAVPTVWLQDHLYTPGKTTLLTGYTSGVYLSYFVGFQICAFVVWVRKRAFFPVYATAVTIAAYIGVLTCFVLPTAPPWFAGQEGHIAPVHRVVEELTSSVDSSAYGGGASVAGVNQVAAMPSLHMALTVLVVLTIWSFTKNVPLRAIALLYAVSMAFSLVYLGEHYVTDEFFGLLTALFAWKLAHRLWASGNLRLNFWASSRDERSAEPVPVEVRTG